MAGVRVWRRRVRVGVGVWVGIGIWICVWVRVRVRPDEARADKDAWPDEATVEAKPRIDEARPHEGVTTRSDKCATTRSYKGGPSAWANEATSPLG